MKFESLCAARAQGARLPLRQRGNTLGEVAGAARPRSRVTFGLWYTSGPAEPMPVL